MPRYGLEYGRVVGLCTLLLCTDLQPAEKEPLLVNFVQVGGDVPDPGGLVRIGAPTDVSSRTSQNWAEPSPHPVRMVRPLGLNATDRTGTGCR